MRGKMCDHGRLHTDMKVIFFLFDLDFYLIADEPFQEHLIDSLID